MKVEVVKYRPEWAEEFEREAEKIKEILGENLLAIHHIGSTARGGACREAHYRHPARRKGYS